MDWFADLAQVPDAAAHTAFRARIQEALHLRAEAMGALAALQSRAMLRPNQPIAAKDALAMKGFEKAAEDAWRLARVQAETYHQGMQVSDIVAWERALQTAEAALALGVTQMQQRFAQDGSVGDCSPLGGALILQAWALCDLPIALRILRSGETTREGVARAATL